MNQRNSSIVLASAIFASLFLLARPAAAQESDAGPFAVEYYYKVKWGHFGEFMDLYKKNHYPILLKLKEMGRIVDMYADYPFYHGAEAARWDFRFTIVWKDVEVAHDLDFDDDPIIAELYPDQALFEKEEQRRFELLIEHMDIPIVSDDFSEWPTPN